MQTSLAIFNPTFPDSFSRRSSFVPHAAAAWSRTPSSSSPSGCRRSKSRRGQRRHSRIFRAAKETGAVPTATSDAAVSTDNASEIAVTAVATVQTTAGGALSNLLGTRPLDAIQDLLGKSILVELVSSQLDAQSGTEKARVKGFAHLEGRKGNEVRYVASLTLPRGFREVGAVIVTNEHHKEMFLKEFIISAGDPNTVFFTSVNFSCRSWLPTKSNRVFFTSEESYLPSETPSGLRRLREAELEALRGDGTGERKPFERIYDYDVYNDLGDPENPDLSRPVIGGADIPYPRRCRTGRQLCPKDSRFEVRKGSFYVPRDEQFSEVKEASFSANTLRAVLPALGPTLSSAIIDTKLGFPHFTAIEKLYNEGIPLPKQDNNGGLGLFRTLIPRLIKVVEDATADVLLFETPAMIDKDKFSWFRDEEFARQTLAGLNPLSIQIITELPLKSSLDPEIYGPPESLITEEVIEREIGGVMSAKEALENKKLFILDYHDLFLPYVHKVRDLEGTTLYGSRTVFFLNPSGTLRPIAIELTRPARVTAERSQPQWKRVFSPCWDATGSWLWKLAKAHVCAQDTGYHQLVTHWLRTHCCTEPYIIAARRQLSEMHPVHRLLHPHFRYTMEINALAREYLINAGGIIETCFFSAKYSVEISAAAYDKLWRFDLEALPADLIRRGVAVADPAAEHGLRLLIEDYPYAADGLLVWSAIKQWVADYVSHYYPDVGHVAEDDELQAFWKEVRTKGHPDKKDAPWWPELKTVDDVIGVLSTIIWVCSSHHAAVNFGQYHFGGYFPNRPTIARKNMPTEAEAAADGGGGEDFLNFWRKPERALLDCFPSQTQATIVMSVLDILSSHSPDEEYLGGSPELSWTFNPDINAAFERFSARLKEIEGIIDGRNEDPKLLNRCGAGIVPYELLKPFSKPGVTGMGIPNSISI